MTRVIFTLSASMVFFLSSCQNKSVSQNSGNEPVVLEPDSINRNYVDSNELRNFFAQYPLLQSQEEQTFNFYGSRNFQYAWFDNSGLNEPAHSFVNMIKQYDQEGVGDTMVYDSIVESWYSYFLDEGVTVDSLSPNMEIMLTAQFFQYAERIWGGIPEEKTKELGWYIKRKRLPYAELLDSMLSRPGYFANGTPVFRQYDSLKKWLQYYRSLEGVVGWNTIVPDQEKYVAGDSSPVIRQIRTRLYWMKDLVSTDTTSEHFDSTLVKAVMIFQTRHGMIADGAIGKKTIDLMNMPLQDRIEQLIVNMERCRWVPFELRGDYITVNIPDFVMRIYNDDTLSWQCNVVVGRNSTKTAIFNGELKYVVLAPYWNVPRSITVNEILPACKKNPGYINSHNMEVINSAGKVISPSQVNWSSYTSRTFPYSIRQKPGPRNSLGKVKFLFPNEYSIYFHDTPAKSLFAEEKRSFSHGCIRVSEPQRLAEHLLRNDPNWPKSKIEAAMNGSKEVTITLDKPVKVFIGYLTAFVTPDGRLNFREDIYDRDKRLAQTMLSNSSL